MGASGGARVASWVVAGGGAVRVAGVSLGTVIGMAVSAMVMSLDSSIRVFCAALRREIGPQRGGSVSDPQAT
jgi:hypothetical protein